jgi:hypothetical protein
MGACLEVGLCTKVSFSKSDTESIKKWERIEQLNCASDVIGCIENEEDFSLRLHDTKDAIHLSSGLYLPFKFDYVPLDTYYKAHIEFSAALFSYFARCVNLSIRNHKFS